MRLTAKLTIGWPDDVSAPLAAPALDRRATEADDYVRSLTEQLSGTTAPEVLALEGTFRRRPGGARALSRIIGGLTEVETPQGGVCRIDAFAYGFLRSAKNLDLVLPLAGAGLDEFLRTHAEWARVMEALEAFERTGALVSVGGRIDRERYLATRAVVSRPTARDELRSLASLLFSGPSTLEQLSADLGLKYTLGQRTVGVFEEDEIGVVERRAEGVFALRADTLPLVLFCLREIMGLDVLSALPANAS